MNVAMIEMPKTDAREKLQEYRTALKTHRDIYLRDLAHAYYQLSRGRSVIDIIDAFKTAGQHSNGDPRLALCRADRKKVRLDKNSDGSAEFWGVNGNNEITTRRPDRKLPAQSFEWPIDTTRSWRPPTRARLSAPVPIIPAAHIPPGALENYFILWEVHTWTMEPPTDPILLRPLTRTLFVVLAQWDLTPIEQAVMRGAMQ